jgi:hypothetical protein
MRSWWQTLGVLTATAGILMFAQTAAHAQFPPPGGYGAPPGSFGAPPGNFGAPPGNYGAPSGSYGAPGMTAAPPGIPPGQEKANPFEMKDDGTPNAFTDLIDPRPRVNAPYVLTFRGEYVEWKLSNGPLAVPLVTTTSNITGTSFGQLGNPNTSILVNSGDNAINYGYIPGFRLSAGLAIGYLPPIEVSGFLVNRTTTIFSGGSFSNPTQLLGIPFQDVEPLALVSGTNAGTESTYFITIPVNAALIALGGTLSITSQLSFWGFESNMFLPLNDSDTFHLSGILGYRHLQLNETLSIVTQGGGVGNLVFFNGPTPLSSSQFTTTTVDSFGTTNSFDGGQFGLRAQLDWGRWSLFSDLKLGLGETMQTLNIGGTSTLSQNVAGRPSQSAAGGVLALPTNSGSFSASRFGVVPETNIALSFQLNHCIRFFAGYDFLYWNSVTRPGDALNGVIDARQIPTSGLFASGVTYNGPSAPAMVTRTFIAQGIFFGVEFGF